MALPSAFLQDSHFRSATEAEERLGRELCRCGQDASHVLDASSEAFQSITEQVALSHVESHLFRLEVHQIICLHNAKLTQEFQKRVDFLAEPNIRLLFHSCPASMVEQVVHEGFVDRVTFPWSMFGQGVYFAQNSTKAAHYSRGCAVCASPDGDQVPLRAMFVCEVALGNPRLLTSAMNCLASPTDEPVPRNLESPAAPWGCECVDCGFVRMPPSFGSFSILEHPEALFHSVVGVPKTWDPSSELFNAEFVVYDPYQALPRYQLLFSTHPIDIGQ